MPDGPPLDPFSGVVTASDVYTKLVQVGEQVRTVEGKVDGAATALGDIRDIQRDHEMRLRLVEADRWPHGKVTLILAAAGVVVALLALLAGVR